MDGRAGFTKRAVEFSSEPTAVDEVALKLALPELLKFFVQVLGA